MKFKCFWTNKISKSYLPCKDTMERCREQWIEPHWLCSCYNRGFSASESEESLVPTTVVSFEGSPPLRVYTKALSSESAPLCLAALRRAEHSERIFLPSRVPPRKRLKSGAQQQYSSTEQSQQTVRGGEAAAKVVCKANHLLALRDLIVKSQIKPLCFWATKLKLWLWNWNEKQTTFLHKAPEHFDWVNNCTYSTLHLYCQNTFILCVFLFPVVAKGIK